MSLTRSKHGRSPNPNPNPNPNQSKHGMQHGRSSSRSMTVSRPRRHADACVDDANGPFTSAAIGPVNEPLMDRPGLAWLSQNVARVEEEENVKEQMHADLEYYEQRFEESFAL